jgi:hypothetical protein
MKKDDRRLEDCFDPSLRGLPKSSTARQSAFACAGCFWTYILIRVTQRSLGTLRSIYRRRRKAWVTESQLRSVNTAAWGIHWYHLRWDSLWIPKQYACSRCRSSHWWPWGLWSPDSGYASSQGPLGSASIAAYWYRQESLLGKSLPLLRSNLLWTAASVGKCRLKCWGPPCIP